MRLQVVCLLLVACNSARSANDDVRWTLLGVGAISRHGDRELLHKDGWTETTPGTLTSDGFERMQRLGAEMRERYTTPLGLQRGGVSALHEKVRAVSSGFDRTISSGNAVMRGMFGNGRVPPVYSEPDSTDSTLRFYTKCANFHKQVLRKRGESGQWASLRSESDALRKEAAEFTGVGYGMDDVWNMHDRLLTYPPTDSKASGLRRRIEELLAAIVDHDYTASAVIPAAGRLLADVNGFVRELTSPSPKLRFRQWFGHFSTLVSFAHLTGLNHTGVPPFGGTLVFEVWQNEQGVQEIGWYSLAVEGSAGSFRIATAPLELRGCGKPCAMPDYMRITASREKTESEWCYACEDTGTEVAMCKKYFMSCVGGVQTPDQPQPKVTVVARDPHQERERAEAEAAFAILLFGAFCVCCTIMIHISRKRHANREVGRPAQPSQGTEMSARN